jgi:hypothetical protein
MPYFHRSGHLPFPRPLCVPARRKQILPYCPPVYIHVLTPYTFPPSILLLLRTFGLSPCLTINLHTYQPQPRLLNKDAKTKTRKKNRDDTVTDSLFWPVMHRTDVRQRLDAVGPQPNTGQPHVIQPYHVPIPFAGLAPGQRVPAAIASTHTGSNRAGTGFGAFHDRCLYSLWMHFADFCMVQQLPPDQSAAGNDPTNKYLGSRRLPIFVQLAAGTAPRDRGPARPVIPADITCSDDEDTDLKQNPLNLPRPAAATSTRRDAEEQASNSSSPTSVLDGAWYFDTATPDADKQAIEAYTHPPGLHKVHQEQQLSLPQQRSMGFVYSSHNNQCRSPPASPNRLSFVSTTFHKNNYQPPSGLPCYY